MNLKQLWVLALILVMLSLGGYLYYEKQSEARPHAPAPVFNKRPRAHLDHSAYFHAKFSSPQDVTRRCLECHPHAATDFMKTAHWQWLGPEEKIPGKNEPVRIGKRNLLNNFCIGVQGNWSGCTKCHAGYGWEQADYDFSRADNVDCLVCHDWSNNYVKGAAGLPEKGVDLLAAAQSVGYPKRENCGTCHYYGGGGLAVKHGDLDNSLDNPDPNVDVHMGKSGFLCIDCHRTEKHQIPGRAFSVSAVHTNGMSCTDCHRRPPHQDERLNRHTARVACATCHIPAFARNVPTKMEWDWSKAGDGSRPDDPHHYLKIKGEFVYADNVTPEYRWFNLSVDRYLMGDGTNPAGVTDINRPLGDRGDSNARIWPFKVHNAKQPYDRVNGYLLPPVTAGEGGYWHEFDWNKALAMGARLAGLTYSGSYGFTETRMYWPLSHGVTPKEQALTCNECHGVNPRLDWKALGYDAEPLGRGGRP
ncbi:MAG: tetrathionate reductase family octaheme c-type cytochrome [Syntrophobacteraceae bacterium]|jgi:octaheme c-type cytochrome (tetrathionate reductase family)